MSRFSHLPLESRQLSVILNGRHCLQDINFCIESVGITIVMGANGAGKTLLLKTCAGLVLPDRGSIHWSDKPTPPTLTLVPQQPVLLDRTVKNNLLIALGYHKVKNPLQRCQEALAWSGISHLANHSALSLSTGEQQLVALARAWALSPGLLLLDEPTANLDPARQQKINASIQTLSGQCKIVLTTHSIQQARELAADILFLGHGKLITHSSADEFFHSGEFKQFARACY